MTEFMKQVLPMLRSPHRPVEEKWVERRMEMVGVKIGARKIIPSGIRALWPSLRRVVNMGLRIKCVDCVCEERQLLLGLAIKELT